MSRGPTPAILAMLESTKATPCATMPSPGTRATTPATAAPTARQANQKPAVNISETNRAIAARNQISQSGIWSKAATLTGVALSNSRHPLRGAAFMFLRALPFLAVAALFAIPVTAQTNRYVLKGDSVAVYNLVGELRVEAGTGSDVVVDVQRGGADAAKLQIESGPLRGRETLRIIYPDDVIVMPDWGRGWNTTMRVRDDGTFGDDESDSEGGHRHGWFHNREDREVRITGRSRDGLEAYADLHVSVPAGKGIGLYLGVGKAFVTNVDGKIRVSVASADISADHTRGLLKIGSGSGNVDLHDGAGDVNLETGSGDITVTGATGTRLR